MRASASRPSRPRPSGEAEAEGQEVRDRGWEEGHKEKQEEDEEGSKEERIPSAEDAVEGAGGRVDLGKWRNSVDKNSGGKLKKEWPP